MAMHVGNFSDLIGSAVVSRMESTILEMVDVSSSSLHMEGESYFRSKGCLIVNTLWLTAEAFMID